MDEIAIYYDGECPFCTQYVRRTRLRDAIGSVRLVNLRDASAERRQLVQRGLDPSKGMVVAYRGQLYDGARAMSLLASLTTPSSAFNKAIATIFRSPVVAALVYPLLRGGRAAALLALGRSTAFETTEQSKAPHGLFFTVFGVFGVLHFVTYAFSFRTPLYPTTYVIGLAGLMLALFPLSRRIFLAMVAALVVDAVLQAPTSSNHTILKNFFLLGILAAGIEAWLKGESWSWFVLRFAPTGRWLLIVMYIFGVFHKINEGFLDPAVSCAVVLWRELPLPGYLAEAAWLHYTAIYGTFVIESAIAVSLLVPRLRYFGIVLGIAFHVLLGQSAYALYAAFSTLTIALHCLFLPPYTHVRVVRHDVPRRLIKSVFSAGGMSLIGLYLAGLLYLAWHQDHYGVGLWWLFVAIPMLTVVAAFGRDDTAASERRAQSAMAGAAPVIGVLFFLNCTLPYFGLKTAQSMNMFANLRVEGGVSNHLVLSDPPAPFRYLEDLVEIVDSGGVNYFEQIKRADQRLVYYEFLNRLERESGNPSVSYRRSGELHLGISREDLTAEFDRVLHPLWFRAWFHFYPVILQMPRPCSNP